MVNVIEHIIFIGQTIIVWKIIWILLAPNWLLDSPTLNWNWHVNFANDLWISPTGGKKKVFLGYEHAVYHPAIFHGTFMMLEWVGKPNGFADHYPY